MPIRGIVIDNSTKLFLVTMAKRYLIIGASAAGIGCALRLRMLDPEASITVLTSEAAWPYNKCHMADVLLGEKQLEEIIFCNEALLAQKRIELVCNSLVAAIDSTQKVVQTVDGGMFTYDALCIATGRSPRMLPLFKGQNFTNLFNFYYKSDLEQIVSYINNHAPRTAVVIGGGLTGLEAADGLRARGLEVTIVEAAAHLLPSLITHEASACIARKVSEAGAAVITGQTIVGYEQKDAHIAALQLQSGPLLPADLVVCAIGATPNTSFLPDLIATQNGFCLVDALMQTSVHGIYAAGDCCMVYDQLSKQLQPSSLWPDAMQQGMHAAYGMVGTPKPYAGSVSIAASGFFGLKVAIAGPSSISASHRSEEAMGDGWYHRFVYEEEKLVGFMLIGNTGELSTYRRELLRS